MENILDTQMIEALYDYYSNYELMPKEWLVPRTRAQPQIISPSPSHDRSGPSQKHSCFSPVPWQRP